MIQMKGSPGKAKNSEGSELELGLAADGMQSTSSVAAQQKSKRGRPKKVQAGSQDLEFAEVRKSPARAQQSFDDTMQHKVGGPENSQGGEQELEEAADVKLGVQSEPAKLKPRRGRPKKSEGGRQEELQVAVVIQSPPRVDTVFDSKVHEQGSPKNSQGYQEELKVPAVGGTQSIFPLAEQFEAPKVAPKRGRPKKLDGDRQKLQLAMVIQSRAGQPLDDTMEHGGSPKQLEVDIHGLEAAAEPGTPSTAPVGELSKLTPKRGRGRPRKSQGDGQEFGAPVQGTQRTALLGELSEPSKLKRKRGRPRKSQVEGTQSFALLGEQSEAAEPKPKRGRGRPKKEFGASVVKTLGERSELVKPKPSRGRGRPPKQAKGRGRPRKSVGRSTTAPLGRQSETAKRKRGRPRKGLEGTQSTTLFGKQSKPATAKGKRGRPRKSQSAGQGLEPPVKGTKQKGKRGRPRKSEGDGRELEAPVRGTKPTRKRGRPRKSQADAQDLEPAGKRKRGRPKKSESATGEEQVSVKKRRGGKPASRQGRTGNQGADSSRTAPETVKDLLTKIEIDGAVFQVGDDVYVRKSEGSVSESDTEVEYCGICSTTKEGTMLECDCCLTGYHLTCLNPPLETVPEGDWVCPPCKNGGKPSEPGSSSQHKHRSAREKLLSGDLWAARIQQMWTDPDGKNWFTANWFLIPEETSLGRQSHNGKRELFRSSLSDDNEMDSILRHCYVMTPQDYKNSGGEGDDVFFCEFEYSEQTGKFKQIEYLDANGSASQSSLHNASESDLIV